MLINGEDIAVVGCSESVALRRKILSRFSALEITATGRKG